MNEYDTSLNALLGDQESLRSWKIVIYTDLPQFNLTSANMYLNIQSKQFHLKEEILFKLSTNRSNLLGFYLNWEEGGNTFHSKFKF